MIRASLRNALLLAIVLAAAVHVLHFFTDVDGARWRDRTLAA